MCIECYVVVVDYDEIVDLVGWQFEMSGGFCVVEYEFDVIEVIDVLYCFGLVDVWCQVDCCE